MDPKNSIYCEKYYLHVIKKEHLNSDWYNWTKPSRYMLLTQ